MNINDNRLAELLTDCEEVDSRIRAAYELGLRWGKELDRENIQRNAHIQTTRKLLNSLMCTQGIDLQTALIKLQIPRAERKTYEKIFAARIKQLPTKSY